MKQHNQYYATNARRLYTGVDFYITSENVESYAAALRRNGKSENTIQKYCRDIYKLKEYLVGEPLNQERLQEYPQWLVSHNYKVNSVNSYLAAANSFCAQMGWDMKVPLLPAKTYRLSREVENISNDEYERLIRTAVASGDLLTAMAIQVFASTKLHIQELGELRVESLDAGYVTVWRRGESRCINLPQPLTTMLKEYAAARSLTHGPVFCTATGRPIDRSNLFRRIKRVCEKAGVDSSKISGVKLRRPRANEVVRVRM